MCTQCERLLTKAGCVSWAGAQVQMGLEVPTCYPGIVKLPDVQKPPCPKKWSTVDLTGGWVKYCPALINERKSARQVGKRWVDLEKADLRFLERPEQKGFGLSLAGIGCAGANPCSSAKTQYNNLKALLGRVFRVPKAQAWGTGPRPGVWTWAKQFVDCLLPDFRADVMSFADWLMSMPSGRRKDLTLAQEIVERYGWCKGFERFKAFVKTEPLPGFAKDKHGLKPSKTMLDRLIQGPADATHCIAGPVLKPLVQRLKKIWGSDNCIFYGSTGPEHLHKWLTETLVPMGGTYFWSDFSMYDNTHSDDSWDFMEYLYRKTAGDNPLFWRVMKAWRRPRGQIGAFKYQARVMNASGRDDTALANAVLNGFATYLSAVAAWLKKPLLEITVADVNACRGDIKLSVCGDDSLGRLPLMTTERMAEFRVDMASNIAQFGFEAKLMLSTKLSDAVYLGQRPVPTRKGWFWGKTIGRATYKMGWVSTKRNIDTMAHITGIADMHILCSSHVPVLSDLARKIAELREKAKRTPVKLDPEKPWQWTQQSGVDYDDVTLQAVADTYTVRKSDHKDIECEDVLVTVADVKHLIAAIRSIRALPCVLDHWLWRHMIWVDDL